MPPLSPWYAEIRFGLRTGRRRKKLLNVGFDIPAMAEPDPNRTVVERQACQLRSVTRRILAQWRGKSSNQTGCFAGGDSNKSEVANRGIRNLGSELNCSGLEQINQYALNITSTHADSLIC